MDRDLLIIDGLQYANWSAEIFRQMREGGVSAVHATICYHENFRETVANLTTWRRRFDHYASFIFHGRTADDVRRAQAEGRTAVFFGFQNCSPIEDDISLVEIWHELGIRFMQLSYNNQSLLASGCYEAEDSGITRMGREVICEMNRVGLAIDMSHSGERSTLQAIGLSERPIAITHANPAFWHPINRNKSDTVLKALAETGGVIGFSLYPHHLRGGTACRVEEFCAMVAECAERFGVDHLAIGSDLCQDQPGEVLGWMRNGRWTKAIDDAALSFPAQPEWFRDNRDFGNVAAGLRRIGFSTSDVAKIMGGNWLRFFEVSFEPMPDRVPGDDRAGRS
jgi:microsomal dipeptidase-like Zn-dependent dipeptidase